MAQICYSFVPSVTPTPFCWGVEPPTKFSKRWGLDRISNFREGIARKESGDFFQEGCSFYIKNKLKYEIFNDKKRLWGSLKNPIFEAGFTKNQYIGGVYIAELKGGWGVGGLTKKRWRF